MTVAPTTAAAAPVPLSSLPRGARATIHDRLLPEGEHELLSAMGLAAKRVLRVCRTGEPVIVQVGPTRLALPASLARSVLVLPSA